MLSHLIPSQVETVDVVASQLFFATGMDEEDIKAALKFVAVDGTIVRMNLEFWVSKALTQLRYTQSEFKPYQRNLPLNQVLIVFMDIAKQEGFTNQERDIIKLGWCQYLISPDPQYFFKLVLKNDYGQIMQNGFNIARNKEGIILYTFEDTSTGEYKEFYNFRSILRYFTNPELSYLHRCNEWRPFHK